MMVTAVIPVDKRKSKVFLEEGFAFVLYRGEVERYRIEEGRELEDTVYEEILRDILCPRSKEYALHLLKDSGNFLKEYHFLDDNAYAQSYVRSYAGKKSRRQMVYEMQQKGVDPSYIEEALDQSPVDEEESARQALARRIKGKQEASYQEKGRLAAFLGRKGYSFEVINRVLREIKTAENQD